MAIKWQKRRYWNNKYKLSLITGWKNVALSTYTPAPKSGVHARHLYFNWISSKYLFQRSSIKCSHEIRKSHSGGKAQASKSRQSLSIGLSTTALVTFTLARRTKSFLSKRTSAALPRRRVLRGEFSTLIRKISPTAKFLQGDVHSCLLWSRGRYSLDRRFQKIVGKILHLLHLRRDQESFFWNVQIQLSQTPL